MRQTKNSFSWHTCEGLFTFSSSFPTGAAIWHTQLTHHPHITPELCKSHLHVSSDMQDELNSEWKESDNSKPRF